MRVCCARACAFWVARALRNRLALYNEGKTQGERAYGEASFAHGGCGGTQFPRKSAPRASARSALSTHERDSAKCVASCYPSAFRRNAL